MRLVPSNKAHIREIMTWFPSPETCVQWGGPDMRFPFAENTFLEDIHWKKMPSYSAVTSEGQLIGFGQFYEKQGRCHLARLAVSPSCRGQGLGKKFISMLMGIGEKQLKSSEFSLYVLEHNEPAVVCYKSLGFKPAAAPKPVIKLKDCIFMIADSIESCGQSGTMTGASTAKTG